MINSIIDLIFTALIFITGIGIGRFQSSENHYTNKISHMKDLLRDYYEKQEHIRSLWLDAEQRAETWQRRYESLVPDEKESNIGS